MRKENILLLFLSISIIKLNAQEFDTTFYSVLNLGKITGENKVWKTSTTEYHYYYYYNDRGRGDVVNATVNTDANGKIEKVNSSGLDYYKAPYTYTFELTKDSLISAYNGEQVAQENKGQYYFFYQAPACIEIMINSLLKTPSHALPLGPGDTAILKEPTAYTISFNNKKIKLLLCNIDYGKGSSPSFTWMDEDHHFFADASGWSVYIKKGFESLADTLHALQETEAIPFYQSIYKKLSDSLPQKFAIKNVMLFDAPNAATIPHITVLVENGMITATGKKIKIPKDFTVINGKGKTLLPGLWDTHGHYSKDEGTSYLSGGITHVRDMGNMADITQMQHNIRLHNLTGPDLSYLSGFIDKDDEYHGPVGKLVTSQAEAIKTIDDYRNAGYNQIKIYSSIDTSWVRAICKEAHRLNMRVAGHIPYHLTAGKAVLDGYDEITHMNMVMFNFFPDTVDTRKNRFKPIGRFANTIDMNGNAVKDFVSLLQEKHTVVEPTISLFNDMLNTFPGDTNAVLKPVINWAPEAWRQSIITNSFVDDTSYISAYKESFLRMMQMLRRLYDSGITLLAGTDGGAQLALHHELETFVQAGIPASEVLKIATYNPAKVFSLDGQYGSVQAGRIADFILVDGNPAENISDIRKVFLVVTNHSLYYPKKIYEYAGWSYYY